VVLIIASNVFFSLGESINAAFLPELAKPGALGKVSGWGWSLGYFGGMLALGLSLAYVLSAQKAGAKAPEFVPVTMWITAAVFVLAAIPTFVLLRERAKPRSESAQAAGMTNVFAELGRSWQATERMQDFRLLLGCAVFYQAGIAVVITLAAIYAAEVMKFSQTDTMALIFLVNIASAIGAFGFGYFQDRLGHRLALQITLVGWIIMVLMAGLSSSVTVFWVAACIAGLCMGASQSCGRAMAGALIPEARLAEFYGLWTLATRLASILGPITYGVVTWATDGNHRLAIMITGLFFVAGLWILARINMPRGIALRSSL
jgi:MFS transporter, UMF1 family